MKMYACLRVSALAALILIAGTAVGLAQNQKKGGDPDQMADRQVAAMKDRLKLTDDQVPKVKTIILDGMKKQRDIMAKYGPPQQGQPMSDDARAEIRKLQQERQKNLADVLTKDQMDEYQKMMSERQKKQKQQ